MRKLLLLLLIAISAFVVAAQDEDAPQTLRESPPNLEAVSFELVADGFTVPLYVTNAGDDSGRLFVLEQSGRIYIVKDGRRNSQPFLDLSGIVSQDILRSYSERGLLGLAFHPNYAENGTFFVNYTDQQGTTHLARYQVSDNPDIANPESAENLLIIDQPYANHNGGHIAFDDDGYLYMALGDGGAANDPLEAGQDISNILGTIIRIDVDNGEPYAIPEDNPFVEDPNAEPEIWAWGLRNPWRFSFDRATDDMYMGDVGQGLWEEINFEPADSAGGLNYGWNAFEASNPFARGTPPEGMVYPVAEYNHANGNCSVVGGYVYRGEAIPDLDGVYFYGDYCSGQVWAMYRDAQGEWQSEQVVRLGFQLSSFGEGEDGELYILDYSGGRLLRLVAP